MRHQKIGRSWAGHRPTVTLSSNMVASLVNHGRIETTDVKAKELRRFAKPTIAWATSVMDVLKKPMK